VICIFCGAEGSSKNVGHIVPESLGGKSSPIGKPGVTCDACNQYFGEKVESKALASFPFIGHRILSGIPSKRGRMPKTQGSLGFIKATRRFGTVELEPRTEEIGNRVMSGEITQIRLVAEVTEPLAVCRMFLKIGLELLGKHFYDVAISDRMAAAREFARKPKRGDAWWFLARSSPQDYLLGQLDASESQIELIERQGILIFVMHMPGISITIPLELGAIPPSKVELPEPEYRIILAFC
jgi:hypothetical protein